MFTEIDTDARKRQLTFIYTDTDTDTNIDIDTITDTDIDINIDTDIDTDSDSDSDIDIDTDSDSDIDTDSDSDINTDTDTDTDINTIIDTRKRILIVSVYSATHFLVDFACAFIMFREISSIPNWNAYMLLYNFCAFAMQMPVGIIADRINRNYRIAALGCALVAAAFALYSFPMAAVLAAGIGNGMFHIGGGVDTLNVSGGKAGALGVFVSPGAFGIYFGTMLGKAGTISAVPILLALVAAAAFILSLRRICGAAYPKNAPLSLAGCSSRRILIATACFFTVVCLRSYIGLSYNFPWNGIGNWGVFLLCAVAFGKAAGGFLADRFGAIKTSCLTLGCAAALFMLSQVSIAGAAAVFLFNMTMPITLWVMANKAFPGAKGFSFGLLTFALFLGYSPAYMGIKPPAVATWPFVLACVISLAFMWFGFKMVKLDCRVD